MIAAFVDPDWIEDSYSMARETARPERHPGNPVITPGKMVGTVLRAPDGSWKMWYTAFHRIARADTGAPDYCSTICLAVSKDGLSWEKPELGLVEDEARRGNNIVLAGNQSDANGRRLTGFSGATELCVLDAASRDLPGIRGRYIAIYLTNPEGEEAGLYLAHSDDGLRWLRYKEGPIIKGWPDSHLQLFYDERAGCYALYLRPTVHAGPYWANRMAARAESPDLLEWTVPKIVLTTDDRDAPAGGTIDEGDGYPRGRDRQVYGMRVFPYCGMYLGLAQVYDVPSGRMWIELARSRDGLHWDREPRREPFIDIGAPGAWDSAMIGYTDAGVPNQANGMAHIYYSGFNLTHHQAVAAKNPGQSVRGIGLALMKADRFAGYLAGEKEGDLITRAFEFPGAPVTLNAGAASGSIAVEITDELGQPLPGFGRLQCESITSDGIAIPLSYTAGADYGRLRGRRVRLHVFARHAAVYGFNCAL